MGPEKWGGSDAGFRGSNASGGRIVLLPGAFWAHGASKMAILGASFTLNFIEGILKRYPEIGDRTKKVLSNPPEGSIEPLKSFYRTAF